MQVTDEIAALIQQITPSNFYYHRDIGDSNAWCERLRNALTAALSKAEEPTVYTIEHDGFTGTVVGSYITREGKRGVVLQQVGTRVVHVYGEKWLTPSENRDA